MLFIKNKVIKKKIFIINPYNLRDTPNLSILLGIWDMEYKLYK